MTDIRLKIGEIILTPRPTVKKLSAALDATLSMEAQVSQEDVLQHQENFQGKTPSQPGSSSMQQSYPILTITMPSYLA